MIRFLQNFNPETHVVLYHGTRNACGTRASYRGVWIPIVATEDRKGNTVNVTVLSSSVIFKDVSVSALINLL